jgi:hypothetical protein
MARKNHDPSAPDMKVVVPIHNAVNERAWVAHQGLGGRAWRGALRGHPSGQFQGQTGGAQPKGEDSDPPRVNNPFASLRPRSPAEFARVAVTTRPLTGTIGSWTVVELACVM